MGRVGNGNPVVHKEGAVITQHFFHVLSGLFDGQQASVSVYSMLSGIVGSEGEGEIALKSIQKLP